MEIFVTKYLKAIQGNRILKVKNSLLGLEKDFKESRGRKLKDREIKLEGKRRYFSNQLYG